MINQMCTIKISETIHWFILSWEREVSTTAMIDTGDWEEFPELGIWSLKH